MSNLSQEKRERMLNFLETIKKEKKDDEWLIAINEIENELNSKKYGLVWEKHEEEVDKKMRTHVPVFTEVKEREIKESTGESYNFLLEGDNLHSLKLLEKTHCNSIGMIYIDPPYNRGENDFKYNDKFVEVNDDYRHSKWISFMNERLLISKKLLTIDGFIAISIDENEVHQLYLLCCEIFGDNNFIGEFIWKGRSGKGGTDTFISAQHEHVLVFAKNKEKANFKQIINISEEDTYENIKQWGQEVYREDRPTMFFPIFFKDDEFILPTEEEYNNLISDGEFDDEYLAKIIKQYEEIGYKSVVPFTDGKYGRWRKGYNGIKELVENHQIVRTVDREGKINLKKIKPSGNSSVVALDSLLLDLGSASTGTKEIKELFGTKCFDTTKPMQLIMYLIDLYTYNKKDAIVLDFFAGSGTTGHAVLELNKEDNGNRTFILCTNNENNICQEITYERMKKAICGYISNGKKEEILYSKKLTINNLKNINPVIEEAEEIKNQNLGNYDSVKLGHKEGVLYVKGENNSRKEVEGIKANLKYFKTDFISKTSDDDFYSVEEELSKHIKEMIELERGISIDNDKYLLVLSDDEMDLLEKNPQKVKDCKAVYLSGEVLLTQKQEALLNGIETIIIPKYYFEDELMEVGEL